MSELMTAEIAVPVALRQTFHYAVPAHLEARAVLGVRVQVSFHRRKVVGYLVARNTPPPEGIKLASLIAVIDEAPTFSAPLLKLLGWMATYYAAPLGELMRAAHPAGTNPVGVPALVLTPKGYAAEATGMTGALLATLARAGEPVPLDKVKPLPTKGQLRRLVTEGLVAKTQCFAPAVVEVATVRAFVAHAPSPPTPRGRGGRTLRRDEVHAHLVGRGAVLLTALRERFGDPVRSHLKQLVDEGAVVETAVEVVRDPFFGTEVVRDVPPRLTGEQARAVVAIDEGAGYRGYLLHGITGSGKTEVYLHAIEAALARGDGALVLVPEIALTPQLVQRFRARLGDAIAVLHSGLSAGARYDQWRRLRRGDVRVAIGTRSAVFAPVKRLALIVVDEEHDPSYKQSDGVRYHGRDMALMRGALEGAAVVLGSATPSLESTRNVQVGKLRRLTLAARATGGHLPPVELVDLRTVPNTPDADHWLSMPLRTALSETLARGEQGILFLNRRGFASFVMCEACGEVLDCDQCSISFTWHAARRHLRCHYCDATRAMPPACPSCGRAELQLLGRGTERVEEALGRLYPNARVARMDRDVVRGAKLQRMIEAMRTGKIDLLIGTQMVTKGHDFPGVTLVGVIAADASLNFPDFRASERTFQLLTQVAGRAGRAHKPGRVLVQTYDPTHPCLQAIREHDHAAFSTVELELRQLRGYPPFGYAVALHLSSRHPRAVEALSVRVREVLLRAGAEQNGVRLRGPAPAPIAQIRGRTRYTALLTAPTRAALARLVAVLDAAGLRARAEPRLVIDIDPYDFL